MSAVSSARGQQLKVSVSGVGWVFQDTVRFPETSRAVQVLQGGEGGIRGATNDVLSGVHDSLERLPLCSCATPKPHTSAVCEDTLDGASIEGRHQLP